MATKQCTKCKLTKPLEEFYLNCYGRNGACKVCVAAKNKAYYEANRRKVAERHAERRAQQAAPDTGALERRQETSFAERYAERREKVNANKRERNRTDAQHCAVVRVDTAFRRALASQGTQFERMLQCSYGWFQAWIEFQFAEGMSHDNYPAAWTYDHVIPKAAFDFRDPLQVQQCNHWSNWRPVYGPENSIKYNKRDLALEETHAMTAYIFQLIQDSWLARGNNAQD